MLMPSSFALFNSCVPIKPQKPFISTYGILNLTQLAVNHNNSLSVLSIAVPFAWASLDNEKHFQMGFFDALILCQTYVPTSNKTRVDDMVVLIISG